MGSCQLGQDCTQQLLLIRHTRFDRLMRIVWHMKPDIPSESKDLNPDPITGEPGSHPVGTGLGAAGGGAAGAAIGAVGGPVGVAVGAAIGAIVGGLSGKGVAEAIDPTAEQAYWQENF